MSRRVFPLVVALLLCATVLPAKSHTPKTNTRDAVKAYVDQAAKFIAKNGADCAKLQGPDWQAGDYYIFVVGPDNRTLCHPNPQIVGKPEEEIVDANGKKVGLELVAAADKGGWVDYVWPRPGTTNPVPKSSYAVKVKAPNGKTYLVGSGGYELK